MKRLIKLAVVLVVLLILLIGGVVFYIDKAAKTLIERGGTYALGVETTVDSADVRLLAGDFRMQGFAVANPEGFDADHFLSLDNAGVDLDIGSLRADTIELPTLFLTGLAMAIEREGGKANYSVILDNLKSLESGEEDDAAEGPSKKFVIHEIVLRDNVVTVEVLPLGGELSTVAVSIAEIRLEEIGSDSDTGVVISDLMNLIVQAVLTSVLESGIDLPKELFDDLSGQLAQLDSLKELGVNVVAELGNQAGGIIPNSGDIGRSLQDAGGDAIKGLGDLIGGGKDDAD